MTETFDNLLKLQNKYVKRGWVINYDISSGLYTGEFHNPNICIEAISAMTLDILIELKKVY